MVPDDYDMMSDGRRKRVRQAPSGRRWRAGGPKLGLDFTAESVVHRLIETVAGRYENRPGGYTRIIRLARPRIGDSARRAILQLVGEEESPGSLPRRGQGARKNKADKRRRYVDEALSGAKRKASEPAEAATEESAARQEPQDQVDAPAEQAPEAAEDTQKES